MACIIFLSFVVFFCGCWCCCVFCIARRVSFSMCCLFLSYLLFESVGIVDGCWHGGCSWNVVYIARWSAIGGDMVPAVVWTCVLSVRVMSMVLLVLW